MKFKKFVFFFIVTLYLSTLTCGTGVSLGNTITFEGGGVTINLTFPEHAHPNTYINHNVTINAHTNLTLQNFTLLIYAPENNALREVKNRTISWDFYENENLTSRIEVLLPQNTSGTLYCVMTVQTDKIVDSLSYKFYTTRISELTFDEMQNLYNKMLANYTTLQTDYETLLTKYEESLVNYTILLANYSAFLNDHNELLSEHNSTISIYESLLISYNGLSDDYSSLNDDYRLKINEYNGLQADYEELNSTRNNLQTSYTILQTVYEGLNQTHTNLLNELENLQEKINVSESALNIDRIVFFIFTITLVALIVLIVYIRRNKKEPYLVVRKELVTMKEED